MSIDLATELSPAISLAYEPAEADIMLRAPRNLTTDRLVSRNLLIYAYLWISMLESAGCLLACELGSVDGGVKWQFFLCPRSLVFYPYRPCPFLNCPQCHTYSPFPTKDCWVLWSFHLTLHDVAFEDDRFAQDDALFCGRSGVCYTLDEQQTILHKASAAWYITLIVSQLFHLLNIKAIHVTIVHHRWVNPVTYYALAVTLSLVIIFVYVPGVQVRRMGQAWAAAIFLTDHSRILSSFFLLAGHYVCSRCRRAGMGAAFDCGFHHHRLLRMASLVASAPPRVLAGTMAGVVMQVVVANLVVKFVSCKLQITKLVKLTLRVKGHFFLVNLRRNSTVNLRNSTVNLFHFVLRNNYVLLDVWQESFQNKCEKSKQVRRIEYSIKHASRSLRHEHAVLQLLLTMNWPAPA